MAKKTEFIRSDEAAKILGVSTRRVQALIACGRLPAEPFGRVYLIRRVDLKLVMDRKPGRPAKAKAGE